MGFLRAFLAAFDKTPCRRAKQLLRENLTAAQLQQHDESLYFEVTGGVTGRRYRIHRADSVNVEEVDEQGKCVHRWCFAPEGHLARGDVLLAQKLALELFETDALAVANKFPPYWREGLRTNS